MFNNRFNSSKNDPLVEAVKQAQAEGDLRRQAVAAVNEQFGVFSRNAVVREDLAAYDAAIEEAYKCMKEGITIEPTTPTSQYNKSPNPSSSDISNPSVETQGRARMGATPAVREEKKLAKKDYDKDGKIESPKDEVWGSRFRAAKAAGKMEEGSAVSGEDPGMAVAKQAGATQQAQTPSSTPKRTGNAAGSTISNARGAAGMNEAQIDEISKDLAHRYAKKSIRRLTNVQSAADRAHLGHEYAHAKHYDKIANKREGGIDNALNKLSGKAKVQAREETQIDEISKELAGRYVKQADYKRSESSFRSGKVYGKELATKRRTKQDVEDSRKHNRDSFKREKGINMAVNKLTGRAKVQANEEVMKESIKAKLLAKHMKEDQSFKSAQVIEANAFDLGKTVPDTSMKIRGGAYPSVAARIKDMATAAKGIAGTAARGLAKGFGNPVTAGALLAAEPTPANSGENEFARQAKYAPKTASAPAATPKPVAPAPTPTAAPTPAPAKSSFYKGGSQGDYTIKKGDTLSSIAKNTGQNVADLAKMNSISDVNKISSGAKLMTKVPTPPSRPADATPTPALAPKPAEPEFKGRMIPPSDSGVGATPPAASFVGSRKEMRGGGPATAPLTSKDFSRQPPSSMQECVQVGANKYRIV